MEKPSDAFRLMFENDSADKKKFDRAALGSSGSILDAVLSDAKGLKHQLGTEDRHKQEEYFTSIRGDGKETGAQPSNGLIDQKPEVKDSTLKKIGAGSRDDSTGGNHGSWESGWICMYAQARQTDFTRVVSMDVANCNRGLDGVSESYHTLPHHGRRKDRLDQLANEEKFLMENIATFDRQTSGDQAGRRHAHAGYHARFCLAQVSAVAVATATTILPPSPSRRRLSAWAAHRWSAHSSLVGPLPQYAATRGEPSGITAAAVQGTLTGLV